MTKQQIVGLALDQCWNGGTPQARVESALACLATMPEGSEPSWHSNELAAVRSCASDAGAFFIALERLYDDFNREELIRSARNLCHQAAAANRSQS